MATFRHTHQLAQLERLDIEAHTAATRLYNSGHLAMAGKVIKRAMRLALKRLSKPESNGDSTCEICGKATDLINDLCQDCYNDTQEPATQDEVENCLPPEFEVIRRVIEEKRQWPNGESIEIWRVGALSLHTKNESGKIKLIAVKDAKRLSQRQINTATVGIFHPAKGYVVLPGAETDYQKLV